MFVDQDDNEVLEVGVCTQRIHVGCKYSIFTKTKSSKKVEINLQLASVTRSFSVQKYDSSLILLILTDCRPDPNPYFRSAQACYKLFLRL